MKTIKLLSMVTVLAFSLSACNTVQGAGKDIETLGQGVKNSAE